MANYQHILVAIDLTAEANKVVEKAIELCKQNEASLSLVHVVEYVPTIYSADTTFPEIPDIEKQLTDNAKVDLKKVKEEFKLTDSESYIRSGSAKHEIIDLTKEINADLIVIGSHGRHGLQLLLGSTSNGVLHLAKCDVLAVRID